MKLNAKGQFALNWKLKYFQCEFANRGKKKKVIISLVILSVGIIIFLTNVLFTDNEEAINSNAISLFSQALIIIALAILFINLIIYLKWRSPIGYYILKKRYIKVRRAIYNKKTKSEIQKEVAKVSTFATPAYRTAIYKDGMVITKDYDELFHTFVVVFNYEHDLVSI